MMSRSFVDYPSQQLQDPQRCNVSPLHLSASAQQHVVMEHSSSNNNNDNNNNNNDWQTQQQAALYLNHHHSIVSYNSGYGQSPWQPQAQQQQGQQAQVAQLTRSSPIAIVRKNDDTDEDEPESSDDDSSIVDVELDAIKLKQKYGERVVPFSYQGEYHFSQGNNNFDNNNSKAVPHNIRSTSIDGGDINNDNLNYSLQDPSKIQSRNVESTFIHSLPSALLKAPYLGSMSRSDTRLHDVVPPMSLSNNYDEPPLDLIGGGGGGGYGSLRDSHRSHRFLDGPASYRDGAGEIRRLNNPFQFRSYTPQVSISERMQQARKLKEQQQKSSKIKVEDSATSSLSAMMDKASKSSIDSTSLTKSDSEISMDLNLDTDRGEFGTISSPVVASKPTSNGGVNDHGNKDDSAGLLPDSDFNFMMSTSLTGLEVLQSARRLAFKGSNDTDNRVQFHSSQNISNNMYYLDQDGNYFKQMGRSLSDPSPTQLNSPSGGITKKPTSHSALASPVMHSNQNPSITTTTTTTLLSWPPQPTAAGAVLTPPPTSGTQGVDIAATAYQRDPIYNNHHNHTHSTAMFGTHDHNPDTDEAFDMDME